MDHSFIKQVYDTHKACEKCPSSAAIEQFFTDLLGVFFPNFSNSPVDSIPELEKRITILRYEMEAILYDDLIQEKENRKMIIDAFFTSLPSIYYALQKDIVATYEGDPAAKSREEVVRAYPGFYAIAAYRIAHRLLMMGVNTIPRLITELAHGKTGIDIHPGAVIGAHFFIDHGTGIVIGETTIIGDHVKIYQGVTLGALSVSKHDAATKRHPTIEDNVIIYSGATILGGRTVVGHDSIIGGNVWLTKSVPPNSKIYYKPQIHEGNMEIGSQ